MTRALARHYPDSKALCAAVLKESGPTALLSFSAGKDAVASWLQLRDCGFTRIVPFYLYLVPGLEFVERGLRYYEREFRTPILRIPHPSLCRMLRNLVFTPPERAAILDRMDAVPNLTFETIEAHVREVSDAPKAFVALGTRTADSPIRLANVRRYGSLNPARRSFLPVFDWKIADVVGAIRDAGLSLTVDYRWFSRSWDGLDWRFLEPIRQHAPRDYARILEFFPLAHLELMRRNLGGAA